MYSYSRPWSATSPGCLIALVDQSGSMREPFGGAGSLGERRCEALARHFNDLLFEFVRACQTGSLVRPRASFAAVGYGGAGLSWALPSTCEATPFLSAAELLSRSDNTETRMTRMLDEEAKLLDVPREQPIWLKPAAEGSTPMCAALRRAAELARRWAREHPRDYPPVVLNFADGLATDVQDPNDPRELFAAAEQVKQAATEDGSVLLFCCHLAGREGPPLECPARESDLPKDPLARVLFHISSEFPDTSRRLAADCLGLSLEPGARGFVFNGNPRSVRQLFHVATVGTRVTEPPLHPVE